MINEVCNDCKYRRVAGYEYPCSRCKYCPDACEHDFYVKDSNYGVEQTVIEDEPATTREAILNKAKECVCGHREQDYGSPEDNFQLIADLWNDYLGLMCDENCISCKDVAIMMALLKIARIKKGGGSGDSYVDLAGYAACAGEIFAKKGE